MSSSIDVPDYLMDTKQVAINRAQDTGSVMIEAATIVYGPRQAVYGDSIDNHERIARIMNAIKHVDDSNDYTAAIVAQMLMALKLSRMQVAFHRDNYVDLIGYIDILHRIMQRDSGDSPA